MRISIFAVLLAVAAVASAQTHNSTLVAWTDSTRDIYIDNELDRGAQVLTADSPSRLVLISTKLESAIVLDVSERIVKILAKDSFQFGDDHTSATSDPKAASKTIGKFTRVDGPIYFFVVDGKPILIRSHPGLTGEMSLDKLWETVPVWQSVMKQYQPNAQAVEAIRSNDKNTTVTLAFGTWCPDSKNYIPRLLKALHVADNAKIKLDLIGIDNQFREPVNVVQPLRITNVPTVIVNRDGHEIGRIVETPAASTMEEDLAAILAGKPPVHNGRWERGARMASGTYSYRDRNGKEFGTEQWEMFSTSEGGYLVQSRITTGDLTMQVFHRVDSRHRPSFAEVTKVRGDERTRTRFNIDNNTMTARVRGSVSGVISQTLEVPQQFFLSSPAIAAAGFVQSPERDHLQISAYITPERFDRALGNLEQLIYEAKGNENISVPAGEFSARHIRLKTDNGGSDWWLHSKLGIPIKGQSGAVEYVLTKFETSEK
jgi:thiol-disulfide isomerase/thioredoxin